MLRAPFRLLRKETRIQRCMVFHRTVATCIVAALRVAFGILSLYLAPSDAARIRIMCSGTLRPRLFCASCLSLLPIAGLWALVQPGRANGPSFASASACVRDLLCKGMMSSQPNFSTCSTLSWSLPSALAEDPVYLYRPWMKLVAGLAALCFSGGHLHCSSSGTLAMTLCDAEAASSCTFANHFIVHVAVTPPTHRCASRIPTTMSFRIPRSGSGLACTLCD